MRRGPVHRATSSVGLALRVLLTLLSVVLFGCPGHGDGMDAASEAAADAAPDAAPRGTDRSSTLIDIFRGQPGVDPSVFAAVGQRLAILRGRVLDGSVNPPAPSVGTTLTLTQAGRAPQQTTTDARGEFTFALDGGLLAQVRYGRADYLPVDREIQLGWGEVTWLDDVVLTARSPVRAMVAYGSADAQLVRVPLGQHSPRGVPLAMARAQEPDTVAAGAYEQLAYLYFPPRLRLASDPAGGPPRAAEPLRVTEFTRFDGALPGLIDERRMPAPLPPATAYTFAAEFELGDAQGERTFATDTRPTVYLCNARGPTGNAVGYAFAPGVTAPAGTYRRDSRLWASEDNGVVLQVVRDSSGAVTGIDVDGDGAAESEATLVSRIGLQAAELAMVRARLGADPSDQCSSWWRVPMAHFSTWDINWPWIPSLLSRWLGLNRPRPGQSTPAVCWHEGSVVSCESQALGERVPLVGTPFTLQYDSQRQQGRRDPYELTIPLLMNLSDDELRSIRGVSVDMSVAGRRITQEFTPEQARQADANTGGFVYRWDGTDYLGRRVFGGQSASIRLRYYVVATYAPSRTQREQVFGQTLSDVDIESSYTPPPASITGTVSIALVPSFVIARNYRVTLGQLTADTMQLGGWTLDAVHQFEPSTGVLYYGNGERQEGEVARPVEILAGGRPASAVQTAGWFRDQDPDGRCVGMDVAIGALQPHRFAIDPAGNTWTMASRGVIATDSLNLLRIGMQHEVTRIAPLTIATNDTLTSMVFGPRGNVLVSHESDATGAHVCRIVELSAAALGGTPPLPASAWTVRYTFPATFGCSEVRALAYSGANDLFALVRHGSASAEYEEVVRVPDDTTRAPDRAVGQPPCSATVTGRAPATCAGPRYLDDLVRGPDERLYLLGPGDTDPARGVLRLEADGTLSRVAGGPFDGVRDADEARGFVFAPGSRLAFSPSGALWISSSAPMGNALLYQLTEAGRLRSIGAGAIFSWSLARDAVTQCSLGPTRQIGRPDGTMGTAPIEFGELFQLGLSFGFRPDGSMVAGSLSLNIEGKSFWLVHGLESLPTVPGSAARYERYSDNGRQLYRFDRDGRHLETVDSITGRTLLTMEWEPEGRPVRRLLSISNHGARGWITGTPTPPAGAPPALVTRFAWTDSGVVITAPRGQQTFLHFNAQGWLDRAGLTSAHQDDAPELSFGYADAISGLLTQMVGPRPGEQRQYGYDPVGRLEHTTNPLNETQTFRIEPQVPAANDPLQMRGLRRPERTVVARSPEGREQRYVVTYGLRGAMTRSGGGQVPGMGTPDGIQGSQEDLGSLGRSVRVGIDGTSTALQFDYEEHPNPLFLSQVIPLTTRATMTRADGTVQRVDRDVQIDNEHAQYPWLAGNVTTRVSVGPATWTTRLDRDARTVTRTSPEGRVTIEHMDPLWRIDGLERGSASLQANTYDDSAVGGGRVASTSILSTDPDGGTTSLVPSYFDSADAGFLAGLVSSVRQVSDRGGARSDRTERWNLSNWTFRQELTTPGGQTFVQERLWRDGLAHATLPGGALWETESDLAGQLIRVSAPAPSASGALTVLERINYDHDGLTVNAPQADGSTLQWLYQGRSGEPGPDTGRLVGIASGTRVRRTLFESGALNRILGWVSQDAGTESGRVETLFQGTDLVARGEATHGYGGPDATVRVVTDERLRVTGRVVEVAGHREAMTTTLDLDGVFSHLTATGLDVAYETDRALGRPAAEDRGLIRRITSVSMGVTTQTTLDFDGLDLPEREATTAGGREVASFQWQRDPEGRIVRDEESVLDETGAPRHFYWHYRYDDGMPGGEGRLCDASRTTSPTPPTWGAACTFRYDARGNRLSAEADLTSVFSADALPNGQDQLDHWGARMYGYDPLGRLATEQREGGAHRTYQWSPWGELEGITLTQGATSSQVTYAVDARGRRVSRTVDGVVLTRWIYQDGTRPIAELDGTGGLRRIFVYGVRPQVPEWVLDFSGGAPQPGVQRVLTDARGSVRLVLSAAGNVLERRAYGPWGRRLRDAGESYVAAGYSPLPFGYAGGLEDPTTGLVHFGRREYDPETGRWLSRDPAAFASGSANLYGYVGGDPVNQIDQGGEVAQLIAQAAIGGGIDVAMQLYENGGHWQCINWNSVALSAFLGGLGHVYSASARAGSVARACGSFGADTRVHAERGLVPIAEVRAGERVWSQDPLTGRRLLTTVSRTLAHNVEAVLRLSLRSRDEAAAAVRTVTELLATPEHPFAVEGRGWLPARELQAGMQLLSTSGGAIVAETPELRRVESRVFNLEVGEPHNFLVGPDGILVHNGFCERLRAQVTQLGDLASRIHNSAWGFRPGSWQRTVAVARVSINGITRVFAARNNTWADFPSRVAAEFPDVVFLPGQASQYEHAEVNLIRQLPDWIRQNVHGEPTVVVESVGASRQVCQNGSLNCRAFLEWIGGQQGQPVTIETPFGPP